MSHSPSRRQFYIQLFLALTLSISAFITGWHSKTSIISHNGGAKVLLYLVHGLSVQTLTLNREHGFFTQHQNQSENSQPENTFVWRSTHTEISLLNTEKNIDNLTQAMEEVRLGQSYMASLLSNGHIVALILLTMSIFLWAYIWIRLL